MSEQPNALRLADRLTAQAKAMRDLGEELEKVARDGRRTIRDRQADQLDEAASELRRLHEAREQDRRAMREALEALDDSAEYVEADYKNNWRHGVPTRQAQLDGLKAQLDAHKAAITHLRQRLEQP
jgi:hypothetical protein